MHFLRFYKIENGVILLLRNDDLREVLGHEKVYQFWQYILFLMSQYYSNIFTEIALYFDETSVSFFGLGKCIVSVIWKVNSLLKQNIHDQYDKKVIKQIFPIN